MPAATKKEAAAPETAPEGVETAAAATAEKGYMYHPREVKTKEYREAHHTSWSVHTRPLPKDPNRYDRLVMGAVTALRKEKRNPTMLRVLEHVKENAAPGAHNIPYKVSAMIKKLVESGRVHVTSRNVIVPEHKKATSKPVESGAGKKKKKTKKAAARKPAKKSVAVKEKSTESALWEYKEHGTWHPYAPEASAVVEEAYQDYLNDPAKVDVRSVQSGMWKYQVDFTNMTQTNIQHFNHTVREIRRTVVERE